MTWIPMAAAESAGAEAATAPRQGAHGAREPQDHAHGCDHASAMRATREGESPPVTRRTGSAVVVQAQ